MEFTNVPGLAPGQKWFAASGVTTQIWRFRQAAWPAWMESEISWPFPQLTAGISSTC